MTLKDRLQALEAEVSPPVIADVRAASTLELARAIAAHPVDQLRAEMSTYTEDEFAAVLETIREHVPGYGSDYAGA